MGTTHLKNYHNNGPYFCFVNYLYKFCIKFMFIDVALVYSMDSIDVVVGRLLRCDSSGRLVDFAKAVVNLYFKLIV